MEVQIFHDSTVSVSYFRCPGLYVADAAVADMAMALLLSSARKVVQGNHRFINGKHYINKF